MWALALLVLFLPAMAFGQDTGKVKAIATFSILGDLVKSVGGDKVDLAVLVGTQGDAHTFEPSPRENIALASAVVVFENGLHMEPWLDKLYESSASKARRVLVTDGIEPIVHQQGREEEIDPHVWHDVSNAMVMVEWICLSLSAESAANAPYYKENADRYLAKLAKLDHWIIDTLKAIPDERRLLITSHNTLGYFARRYGFKIAGTAIESATTDAADPSAAQMAALVDKVRALGIKVLFMENTHNPRPLQSVAAETGARIAPALCADALGPLGGPCDTYIKMIEHNTKILAQALE